MQSITITKVQILLKLYLQNLLTHLILSEAIIVSNIWSLKCWIRNQFFPNI